jgi:stage II sporulation protein D
VNVTVGLVEGRTSVEVELTGHFTDPAGKQYAPGKYRFTSEITLTPSDLSTCSFMVPDVTIGIGFHWEREERQAFRGRIRIIRRDAGLAIINEVPLEEYVLSVISSEMSASCPLERLKAHAVISRSWLWFPKASCIAAIPGNTRIGDEIVRWYGREAHPDFDVCADDHCQRYQGITKAFSAAASEAVHATSREMLFYKNAICDARFSKCCGGMTERYSTAWDDQAIPYLEPVYDAPKERHTDSPEAWIRSNPPAYCNTRNPDLLRRILPGFDQETQDFYRWRVEYAPDELGELIRTKLGIDLGVILDLQPLARGASGRIFRLRIAGKNRSLTIGKELEIRRALSQSHLYSSAFVVDRAENRFLLTGAGWGHGVGLCQIGAAVMASEGKNYREILSHYYRGTDVSQYNQG